MEIEKDEKSVIFVKGITGGGCSERRNTLRRQIDFSFFSDVVKFDIISNKFMWEAKFIREEDKAIVEEDLMRKFENVIVDVSESTINKIKSYLEDAMLVASDKPSISGSQRYDILVIGNEINPAVRSQILLSRQMGRKLSIVSQLENPHELIQLKEIIKDYYGNDEVPVSNIHTSAELPEVFFIALRRLPLVTPIRQLMSAPVPVIDAEQFIVEPKEPLKFDNKEHISNKFNKSKHNKYNNHQVNNIIKGRR